MLVDGVIVREFYSEIGFKSKGIFADEDFPSGSAIWIAHPAEMEGLIQLTSEEIHGFEPKELREILKRYGCLEGDDLYITTLQPELDQGSFFNHSCEPNCWIKENNSEIYTEIYTLRDVKKGEHLCIDYATFETEASSDYGMLCECGASVCRKRLTFSEWRSKEFMKKFAGHTSKYLRQKHAEHRWLDPRLMLRFRERERKSYGLFVIRQPEFSFEKGELVINLKLQKGKNGNLANPIDQIRHSSEPSCEIVGSNLQALRELCPGDEITLDFNCQVPQELENM